MPRCAFLTTDTLDDFVTYDRQAVAPLAALGWTVDEVPWRAEADWDAFDVVVVRSPWDYQDDPDAFLDVLAAIDASTARLENPLAVMRWNLRKTYLRDLDAAGVPIVPTRWADGLAGADLDGAFGAWGTPEVVAKPVVSANADGTFRLGPDPATWAEALVALADRPCLVQPFVPDVVARGEWSVFAFGGAVSHAILKTPAPGDFRVQEEHGGVIRGVSPEPDLLALADAALAAVPWPEPLLYARVDAVRMPSGSLAVMELELIEPSLYFPYAPGSAARFAAALDALR
ncbi:ATP-grasp domain-containing protein [Rubrivirga sp.]|uniref:ATP-grasp domain-containing protein n=1 Tax=Rubrivirga sp. TaxID=1885344 RepID=UPI003B519C5B